MTTKPLLPLLLLALLISGCANTTTTVVKGLDVTTSTGAKIKINEYAGPKNVIIKKRSDGSVEIITETSPELTAAQGKREKDNLNAAKGILKEGVKGGVQGMKGF